MYIQGAGKQIYLYTIMMLELFLLNQPVSAASATSYPLAGVVVLKTWPSCIRGKFTLCFGGNSETEIMVTMARWVKMKESRHRVKEWARDGVGKCYAWRNIGEGWRRGRQSEKGMLGGRRGREKRDKRGVREKRGEGKERREKNTIRLLHFLNYIFKNLCCFFKLWTVINKRAISSQNCSYYSHWTAGFLAVSWVREEGRVKSSYHNRLCLNINRGCTGMKVAC